MKTSHVNNNGRLTHRNGVQLLPSQPKWGTPQDAKRWFLDMCDRFFATWFATSRPINCAWNVNWKSSAGSGLGVSVPLENHHFLNYLFLWSISHSNVKNCWRLFFRKRVSDDLQNFNENLPTRSMGHAYQLRSTQTTHPQLVSFPRKQLRCGIYKIWYLLNAGI